jgi:GTPase SAR1 family protein
MKSKYIYLLWNFLFLIIVLCIGSSRVGKTSLIKR